MNRYNSGIKALNQHPDKSLSLPEPEVFRPDLNRVANITRWRPDDGVSVITSVSTPALIILCG